MTPPTAAGDRRPNRTPQCPAHPPRAAATAAAEWLHLAGGGHSDSRTGVARIQRPGFTATSSPPRSIRTTTPPRAAAGPLTLPSAAAPFIATALLSLIPAVSRHHLRGEHRRIGVAARLEAPLRRQAQEPRRLPAQQGRQLLQRDVPRRDPRPPQARQELAARGALLGPEAHHAYCAGAHRRPPLRRRHRLGEQQVRRHRHRDAAARLAAAQRRRQRRLLACRPHRREPAPPGRRRAAAATRRRCAP